MKVGSLFSGIGGFDLGFERASHHVLWQSEIDKNASQILAKNWPGVVNHGDVTKIDAETLEPVDLICGGFPCQDLSVIGRGAGLEGYHSGLFWEAVRVAEVLRPRIIILENVPGLLSSHNGADFAIVLNALAELGYGVAWRVLDSQFFGVPQRRRRIYIAGHLRGVQCAGEILFEPGSSSRESPKGQGKGTIAPTLTTRSPRSGSNDEGILIWDQAQISSNVNRLRVEPGRPAPTMNQEGRMYMAKRSEGWVRRVTPKECERLQGFPDGFTEGLSDTARYRALGNAVTVPVAEWIGRRIAIVDNI